MRLYHLLLALALLSSLSYADSWKFDAWNYRYKIIITEPGIIDRSDWPVDVPVYFAQGRVADCAKELRVTNSDGTEMPVYVYNVQGTNGSCTGANVVFKVPALGRSSSTTYYVYYGNSKASAPGYASFDPYYSLRYTDSSFLDNYENSTELFAVIDECETSDVYCTAAPALPWPFSFYGTLHTEVPRVNTNGVLSFSGMGTSTVYTRSEGEFRRKESIAPFWDDLVTTAYYEAFSNPSRVVFVWTGYYSVDSNNVVNTQVTLYKTGDIKVSYGNITSVMTGYIAGLSKGDTTHYIHSNASSSGYSAFFQYSKAASFYVGSEEQHFPPVFSNFTVSKSLVKYGESVNLAASIDEDKGIQSPNGVDTVRSYVKTPKDTLILPVTKKTGTLLHGEYSSAFSFNGSQLAGVYDFYFWACDVDGLCATSDHKTVELNPSLKITLKTNSLSYNQTDTVNVSGDVRDSVGRVVNDLPLSVEIVSGSLKERLSVKTNDLGVFSLSYKTSTTDPTGDWSLSANATDSLGNFGSASSFFTVSEPRKKYYYNVMVLSPVVNTVYRRGEEVKFSVQVTEGGAPVSNATVTTSSPSSQRIDFTEAGDGMYTASYRVPYDSPLGTLDFPVSAMKKVGEAVYSGAASVPVGVEAAKLRIEVVEPVSKEFVVGDPVTFKVKVFYPDNTLSKSTVLNATLNGRPVVFQGVDGLYSYSYVANESDVEGLKLSVAGADLSDNRDEAKVLVAVREKTQKEAFQAYADTYWYAPPLLVLALLLVVLAAAWPHIRLRRLGQQLKDLEESKKFIEDKFFIKREISKSEFDVSIKDVLKKIAETKEKLSKAEGVKQDKQKPVSAPGEKPSQG